MTAAFFVAFSLIVVRRDACAGSLGVLAGAGTSTGTGDGKVGWVN